MKCLSKNGVCSESLCPYENKGVPSDECKEEAKKTKSIVYEKIPLSSTFEDIISILDNESPVIFNYDFYEHFLNCKNNIITTYDTECSNILGVQTGVICGYEKDYFIVNNNWGTDWGESGYVWIHKDIVLAGNDFWVLNKITKEHVNNYIKREIRREKMIIDTNDESYYSD